MDTCEHSRLRQPGAWKYPIMWCGGLVLRVTAAGVKSWSFRFRDRITQAPLRVTIGRYPDVGLAAARGAADGYRKTVSAGGNPAEAKRGASGDKSSARLPSAI